MLVVSLLLCWILPCTVGLPVNNLTHAQFMFPVVFVIKSCLVVVGIIACCGVFLVELI